MKSTCRLVAFIDMNTYILTEGRNFKTFLKENDATSLDCCYLFTKKVLNMELNMMFSAYGVYIHYAFLKFTVDSINTWNTSR